MASVMSSIRAEVSHGASPMPEGAKAFSAYAIASAKGLILEMENAARLTLDQPMTFENLREGLRLFEGWALRDLVNFRRRCGDNLVTCLATFLGVQSSGPSSIWVGCPDVMPPRTRYSTHAPISVLPTWLNQLLILNQNNLKYQMFAFPLNIHSIICQEYFTALRNHATCNFCMGVHTRNGSTFCAVLENKLAQARDKVIYSLYFWLR